MQFLNRLYSWYGKRVVLSFFAVVALLILIGTIVKLSYTPPIAEEAIKVPVVTTERVGSLGETSSFTVIGTVSAVSEAQLQTEAGGRITRVNAEIGDTVSAGSVIATIENASQYASLLQAEGVYEGALAAAASSDSSQDSAKTSRDAALESGINAYRSAFIAVDTAIHSTADQIFSNPRSQYPGLKINGFNRAPALSEERAALEDIIASWSEETKTITASNVTARLPKAQSDLERVTRFIEELATIIDRQQPIDMDASEKAALQASFAAARNTLSSVRSSLSGAASGIDNAEEALLRAEINASNGTVSASSAQLKQALGTLRQAQANYENTIVRTPITGTINALYLKTGTYVSPGQPAAVIANNGSLEIDVSVSDEESGRIRVGDAVEIEKGAIGTITAIAGAIDPLSGKVAVKINVDDEETLENGSRVRVTFSSGDATTTEVSDTTLIPLTALKITAEGAIVFTVSNEMTLVATPVELGSVRGEFIEITAGITNDTEIVVDARGRKAGEAVEISS